MHFVVVCMCVVQDVTEKVMAEKQEIREKLILQ